MAEETLIAVRCGGLRISGLPSDALPQIEKRMWPTRYALPAQPHEFRVSHHPYHEAIEAGGVARRPRMAGRGYLISGVLASFQYLKFWDTAESRNVLGPPVNELASA